MSTVWHVPADDGSGEVEIRPVTIVSDDLIADALLGAEEILEVLHLRGTRGVEQECDAGRIADVYAKVQAAKRRLT